ncbi:G-type lectin S-receptor-like serine/threonine-protein kinase At1g11330 isoform X2 [Prosopis cineraria]|uniref:G-type lectin S-receptor-like serine/threonine-protein kinase At1g11330 isoform X2 n=1 Tax=Prosopis cineraria TaxID=364024 RepID=UPI00240F4367|nr:G-type lectin S-receptor-like serine/threonine-protein kinase At1g11330 isoform X2 [Prosopis cineraria]
MCLLFFIFSCGLDTLTASESMKDPDTLTSDSTNFTLGFFSPENSSNRYLGIWYVLKTTVVWVANRNEPLTDSPGILKISENGNLVMLDGEEHVVWSSDGSDNDTSHVILQLQDSGNLVVQNNITGIVIWQSFHHLSNTILQRTNGGFNAQTGQKFMLTSWKSPSDPSVGSFTAYMGQSTVPQLFVWNNSHPYWRGGPWNGQIFTGIPNLNNQYLNGLTFQKENGTFYLHFVYINLSPSSFYMLNFEGILVFNSWDDNKKEWVPQWTVQQSDCDLYGICGSFGSCDPHRKPICSCLRGFVPRNTEEWNKGNWTSGCVRRKPLKCDRVKNETRNGYNYDDDDDDDDGFAQLENTKVPDLVNWTLIASASPDCRIQCLNNCSCLAYAYDAGIGCMMWSENLIDIQRFSSGGLELYIRLANSELKVKSKSKLAVTISIPLTIGTILIAAFAYIMWRRSAKHQETEEPLTIVDDEISSEMLKELPLFEFEKLAVATNNFHSANKIGQGGFGPVYKGKLQDGQEVAVKRLSSITGQGHEEFMTEVVVISKLQHRNLVRLLGCCVEGGEKMLIYEYMPNKSLAAYLFDPLKQDVLDWQKRYHIIEGTARGLLYLHRDSRLRIIHRDLKASNVLLDQELNPKISDFGTARIFGVSKDEGHTRRIVGTYGYMPPEYAIEGIFSEKSDVFSFGVLLLETISGRKSTSFYNDQQALTLIGFAWKLWNEENIMPLIDPKIHNPQFGKDMMKCIHIGLLCVQELAKDRPTMDSVILMLHSKIVNLPFPKQPAFVNWQAAFAKSSHNQQNSTSNYHVTITNIQDIL